MIAINIELLEAKVEAELKDIFSERTMPLYNMMAYHLGWQDERGNMGVPMRRDRHHGVACLAAAHAAGGEAEAALPAAAAVELVHNFAQIHDDVQGGHPQRFKRDAVWWVWGPAQAINAGDGMYALARLALFRLMDRGISPEVTFGALKMLDIAGLEVCEGRFRDFEAQERIDMSVEAYMAMASSKTGALLACSTKLGALASGAPAAVVDAMGVYGTKMGIAWQVREDLDALWPTDPQAAPPSTEVLNKKKLLPVVHALEQATLKDKRRLGEIYFKRVLQPEDVISVRGVLEELGARDFCEGLVKNLRQEAHDALVTAGVTAEGKKLLAQVEKGLMGE
ncbi:MAG: polyprenyl synthetase family protein [SAR202 cluster bacterium]|nr:polyprenyl synthetase family protein [SAR202 cluster bacterium]